MELWKFLKSGKISLFFLLLLLAAAGSYFYEQVTAQQSYFEENRYDSGESIAQMEEYREYEERQAAYADSYETKLAEKIGSGSTLSSVRIFQDPDSFPTKTFKKHRRHMKDFKR